MRRIALPCLIALGLASACASVDEAPSTVVVAATAPVPAPRPVAGYDWHLTADAASAHLAYGLEASDDLRLGLTCDAGTGKVDLTALGPTDTAEIHLESGGDTERFSATSEPSEIGDGHLLTATVDADEPVLQRFRRVLWIAQWTGDRREVYAPHPGSEAGIERFFATCG